MNNQSNINYVFGQLSDNNSQISSKALSSSSQVNSSSNNSTSNEVIQSQLSNVKFIWKEKGQLIYLTGSFCNWKEKFLLQKTAEGYSISLNLPEGIHQYKFIVDGEWKYSHHHPTTNEQSYINNIIEVKPPPVKEVPPERKNSGYSTNKDIIIERQPVACHSEYQRKINFNSSNKTKWMNDSYDKLPSFLHVYTNHSLIGDNYLNDNPFLHHFSFIRKIRKKFVTVTYYTKTKG